MPINKKFQVKVFEADGTTFINTLNPNEIRNEIFFKSQKNYGQGQLSLTLDRPFDDFGEGGDIEIFNIVKVYESDEENVDPRLIYTGFMSQYTPFTNKDDEGVKVICLGLLSALTFFSYRQGMSLEFNKNDSPENIIAEIVFLFSMYFFGLVTTNLAATGVNSDIDFSKQDSFNAIQAVFATIGGGFYFYLDNQVLNLLANPTEATHVFTIGKDIDSINAEKSSEEIINFAELFYDGGTVTAMDFASMTANGIRERVFTDLNIQDLVTAQNFVDQKVAENKDRKIKTIMRINSDYNIETIKPGHTCKILNINEDQTTFTDNMQISSVAYDPDFVVLELEDFRVNFGIELERFIS